MTYRQLAGPAAAVAAMALLYGCGGFQSEARPAHPAQADRAGIPESADHAGHVDHGAHAGHRNDNAHGHAGHAAAVVDSGARLEVLHDARRGKVTILIGPVLLPPAHDGMVMRLTPGLRAPLGYDGWLTGVRINVEDASGAVLPEELLHHVNLILPERRDLFRPMMQRLAAAGRETGAIALPWPLALRVSADEPMLVVAMLHNESQRDYGDVYVRLTMDAPRGGSRVAVQPFMMDVRPPPEPASWDLPPGVSRRSWEGSPAVDGKLLGVGAHMHRYGQELVLEDVTTGRVLHRSRPVLDADGEIVSIPRRKFLPFGLRLRASHTYRVTAVYDNPTGQTIVDGAMGVFGGVFRPSAPWPVLDPTDPLHVHERAATVK